MLPTCCTNLSPQMLYHPLTPDVVPTSHSSLYKQTELVATSDFFLSVAVIQTPASGHRDPAWSWLMSLGACFGRSPAAHCRSPGQSSCPLAAAPLTHVSPRTAPRAAGGGEPKTAFSQFYPLTAMFGFSDLISWYVPR